jgi:hypothetical protein
MLKIVLKPSVTCFKSYPYKVNVVNSKSAKHIVRSQKSNFLIYIFRINKKGHILMEKFVMAQGRQKAPVPG